MVILLTAVEGAQQAHHVVVVSRRWRAAAADPIEQVHLGAVEQAFEPVKLVAVEAGKRGLSE